MAVQIRSPATVKLELFLHKQTTLRMQAGVEWSVCWDEWGWSGDGSETKRGRGGEWGGNGGCGNGWGCVCVCKFCPFYPIICTALATSQCKHFLY